MIVLVFNIVLPTADIGTDVRLIARLLEKYELDQENNLKFQEIGLALLMPCLLNYVVCFITWFRLEKQQKSKTFIVALLNLYPQFCKLIE